jgi:hypothetical protein
MEICFDHEKQKEYKKDHLLMQEFEFGIQPVQIFNTKFPELKNKYKNKEKNKDKDNSKKLSEIIKQYNMAQFEQEHSIIKGDKEKCFICRGYNNKHPDYIKLINLDYEKYFKKNEDLIIFFHYLFVGDVLGNIFIYERKIKYEGNKNKKAFNRKRSLTEKNAQKRSNANNSMNEKNEIAYKEIKKITDHYKQIKYIDYNNRLNLFLSYSLDGFINIYTFPKCKLVRTINVCDITNLKEILEKVVLVSNPFPMIFCYDKKNMYLFTLNADLIKKKPIEYNNFEIYPIIDRNCGIINDLIKIEIKDEFGNSQTKEILFPSLSEKIMEH